MRINSIINRYVFREMMPPFLISLVLFTFLFFMAKILDVTDLVVNHGVSLSFVFLLLICSIPSFLVFVFPMSTMMGVLLGFLRMSNDNEIIAMKGGGLSLYRLLPPVFVFCSVGFVATAFMCIYGSPWGRLSFKAVLLKAATSNISIGLKERTFNDSFEDVMLYVSKIDGRENTLTDVFIEDRQASGIVSTVVAPKGRFLSDSENNNLRLTLFNGIINNVKQKDKTVHSVSFDTYDFDLKLAQVLSAKKHKRKNRKEMSLVELRQSLSETDKNSPRHKAILMEYHKRFSIPVACFVLGIIAVPLGIQSRLTKRSFGMVLGLFFFLIYYILLSAGWVAGESGILPPVVGIWSPNVVIGAVGLYLLVSSAKERPVVTRLTGFVGTQWEKISRGKGLPFAVFRSAKDKKRR
ncbi:MAG: LPS export ABC transporter permease LptF [Thermodesulfobacteriota bacterium]|nr:LPS export ABC transporter permease LptF [Thermodesulfobacteriota bacterium]